MFSGRYSLLHATGARRILYTRTARAGQTDQVVTGRKFSLILGLYQKAARLLFFSVQVSTGRSG